MLAPNVPALPLVYVAVDIGPSQFSPHPSHHSTVKQSLL